MSEDFDKLIKKEIDLVNKKQAKKKGDNEISKHLKEQAIKKLRGNDEFVEKGLNKLSENFDLVKSILKKYVVMKEDYYNIVTLWILGTYFHNEFASFPYLFFNAMKGSGKSRSIKLITTLAKDGQMMMSPTEAVLFRTKGTLGIDEFESVANKDKSSIRELLNSCYKKGTKIMRMKRKKTPEGDEQVVENFEPYRPIVIANIWGMEEVLGDRCITLILEKSKNPGKTKLIEDFENDESIKKAIENFKWSKVCSIIMRENIYKKWNEFIMNKYESADFVKNSVNWCSLCIPPKNLKSLNLGVSGSKKAECSLCSVVSPESIYNYTLPDEKITTHTTHTTKTKQTTQTTSELLKNIKLDELFRKIDDSNIYGRDLELFLPLFFIAYVLKKGELVDEIIEIAKKMVHEKKHEEEVENWDVLLIKFISSLESGLSRYLKVRQLTNQFREEYDLEE